MLLCFSGCVCHTHIVSVPDKLVRGRCQPLHSPCAVLCEHCSAAFESLRCHQPGVGFICCFICCYISRLIVVVRLCPLHPAHFACTGAVRRGSECLPAPRRGRPLLPRMGDPASFFQAWEPPPRFTPAPADAALAQRVAKLAQFAARNGPSFVELIRAKQAANAEYGFLRGGDGADFWRWTLHCALHGLPAGAPLAAAPSPLLHVGQGLRAYEPPAQPNCYTWRGTSCQAACVLGARAGEAAQVPPLGPEPPPVLGAPSDRDTGRPCARRPPRHRLRVRARRPAAGGRARSTGAPAGRGARSRPGAGGAGSRTAAAGGGQRLGTGPERAQRLQGAHAARRSLSAAGPRPPTREACLVASGALPRLRATHDGPMHAPVRTLPRARCRSSAPPAGSHAGAAGWQRGSGRGGFASPASAPAGASRLTAAGETAALASDSRARRSGRACCNERAHHNTACSCASPAASIALGRRSPSRL